MRIYYAVIAQRIDAAHSHKALFETDDIDEAQAWMDAERKNWAPSGYALHISVWHG